MLRISYVYLPYMLRKLQLQFTILQARRRHTDSVVGQRNKDKEQKTNHYRRRMRTRTHTTRQTYRTYCGRGRPHPDSIGGYIRRGTPRLYKALAEVLDAIRQVLIAPLPGIVKHFRRGTPRLYRALRNIIGHYCLLL